MKYDDAEDVRSQYGIFIHIYTVGILLVYLTTL